MRPFWKQLPVRPPCGSVDPRCLPNDDAVWSRFTDCFNRPPKLYRKTICATADGGLLIRSSAGWEMRVLPWPEPGIIEPHGQRLHFPTSISSDGCILPCACTAALRKSDGPTVRSEILGELGLNEEAADALRAFNERVPPEVRDTIFRWRFQTGHYPVAAACALPGFTTLLNTNPQLAFLTAVHILRNTVNQPLGPFAWEPLLKAGPRHIASKVFGLPDHEAILRVVRRLHFNCLDGGETPSKDFLTAFKRRRAFETLLSLEAPVSPWVLWLLASEPDPHPALVRRTNEYQRRDGNDHVASVIYMNYMILSERLKDRTIKGYGREQLSRVQSPVQLEQVVRCTAPH